MKKIYLLCIALLLCTACQKSKSPEEVREIIDQSDYQMLFSFNASTYDNDLYDLESNCYNEDGVKKSCRRIQDLSNDVTIMLLDDSGSKINISVMKDEQGVEYMLGYQDDTGMYSVYSGGNSEWSYLIDDSYENSCTYMYKSDSEETESSNLCSSDKKTEADKLKNSFNEHLDKLGISKDEFSKFGIWMSEHDGQKLREIIEETRDNQKTLTAKEIKDEFAGDFEFTKVDSGIYGEGILEKLLYMKERDAIVYTTDVYKDFSLFIYNDGTMLAGNKTCAYDVIGETIVSDKNCNKEEVSNIQAVEYTFNEVLSNHKLSIDDLWNLFKNYPE